MSIVNFSDVIAFSRSTGGGLFNAAGKYTWVPANEQRIDYDPVTGECRGLLVEEQRTNLFTYSQDFTNAVWFKGRTTVTANATTAPDGSLTADKLVENTENGSHQVSRLGFSFTASTTYTVSFYAKPAGRNFVTFRTSGTAFSSSFLFFNLTTGAITISSAGGVTAAFATSIGNGWFRCIATFTATSTSTDNLIFDTSVNTTALVYQGDGTSGIYIWGAQLEVGTFPTSYIPTTNSQVTRSADVAMVNNLNPWFNAEEGMWKVRAQGIVGRPILTAGSSIITANSAAVKDYTLTYNSDPVAEFMQIGQGHIQKIEYYPNGNAGGGNA